MPSTTRVAVVALLVVAACGGNDDGGEVTSARLSTTTTGATVQGTEPDAGGAVVGGDSTPSDSAAASPADAPTPTTSQQRAEPAASSAPGAAEPVVAGRYRYRQSGSSTAGGKTEPFDEAGTLEVHAANDGRQLLQRYFDSEGPPSDTLLRFDNDGVFIESTTTRSAAAGQSIDFECTFDPPIAAPPWPPAVGATFAGSGDCDSFTADVGGSITSTRQLELDGAIVDVFVIEYTVTTHGAVESETTNVEWYAPSLRFSVHTESSQAGTYGFVSFSSDVTSDLLSARPEPLD